MKNILYVIFNIVFRLCRILPLKENRVLLMCIHNEGENGALSMMEGALKAYGGYEILWFRREQAFRSLGGKLRFMFGLPRQMATARYILFNDNIPVQFLIMTQRVTIIPALPSKTVISNCSTARVQREDDGDRCFFQSGHSGL